MILSILATVAVLAAIAVIAAALVLAETVLVYVALGLAGLSVLLLLGALVQGRFGGNGPDRSGTDGLGKASVHTATTSAAAPGAHVEPEPSGRVPAPVSGPVRELPVPEYPSWSAPASDDSGHEEPEYDVPRWQTPTAHEWPEPDTVNPDPAPAGEEPSRRETPDEGDRQIPAQASEERVADTAPEPDLEPGSGAGEYVPEASSFSYSIPGRSSGEAAGEDVSEEPSADGSGNWMAEEDWAAEEDVSEEPSADGSGDRTEEEEGVADTAPEPGAGAGAGEYVPEASSFSYSIPGRSSGEAAGEDVSEESPTDRAGDRTGEEAAGEPETTASEAAAEDPEPVADHGTGEEAGAAGEEDGGEGAEPSADEGSEGPRPFSYRVPVGPSGEAAEEDEDSEENGEGDSAVAYAAAPERGPGSGSDDDGR